MEPAGTDLLLHSGTVLTMEPSRPRNEAVAIRGGRVAAVGSTAALVAAHPDLPRLDLRGRTALPGFIETHSHPYFYGMTLRAEVDAGTPPNASVSDIVDRVEQACRAAEPGRWVLGFRYDDTLLREMRHLCRDDLDPVSGTVPVLLVHVSGHFATVNTAGMRALGLTESSPDPVGGSIVRGRSGRPTGTLAETAAITAYAQLPKAAQGEMEQVLRGAGRGYLANGVTTVHDAGTGLMGGEDELRAWHRVVRGGGAGVRVRAYLLDGLLRQLTGDGAPPGPSEFATPDLDPELFAVGGVKIIADGSIQGLTGCLSEPYTCAPDSHGLMLQPPDRLAGRVGSLHDAGWQVAVHGNGDAAIGAILAAHQRLGSDLGTHRHRIEHCQMVREDQLAAMAELGTHASFFVKHVHHWGDRHRDRFLGPERAARLDPLASATRHGIRFGLHADTPVTPVDPLRSIHSAVTRLTSSGQVLGGDQAVDVLTALAGYTSAAAHLGFHEHDRGRLAPGLLGDVTVLSEDPTRVSPDRLADLQVEATVVGGVLAHHRDDPER